jgi:hypothetical protein
MNRALFITTRTSEPQENVDAWEGVYGEAARVDFDINGPKNDAEILSVAKSYAPDVMFYTGGESGAGLPEDETFKALRDIGPLVQIQGDMADPPWHPVLRRYREKGCFDLMVAMDGAPDAPVDFVTLTPLDLRKFPTADSDREILCGFSGNMVTRDVYNLSPLRHETMDPRAATLYHVKGAVIRLRDTAGPYADYVGFMRKCRMLINTSWAGSGKVHHLKGRVLEAAFSGCALLEMRASPISHWFPSDCYFTYETPEEADAMIQGTPTEEMDLRARLFGAHARAHYGPKAIYDAILSRLP